MRHSGDIKTWDDEKGFGFVQPHDGSQVVFLHIKAFRRGQPRPVGGESVSYELTSDERKRPRAAQAEMLDSPAGISAGRALLLLPAGFLAAVTVAAWLAVIPGWVAWVYAGASVVTAFVYAADKVAAGRGAWRTPEATLHLLGAMGGWPGGLVAQRMFHHKTKKQPFQIIFWLIVCAHLALWAWLIAGHPADVFR